jgi:hypothetical protein
MALFTVQQEMDLNTFPDCWEEQAVHDDKFICCCCCKYRYFPFSFFHNKLLRDGPITADIRLNHTGVVPGEMLEVSGEVVNENRRDIDGINIMLLETSIFKKTHITNTTKVLEIKLGKVDPYSTHSLEGTVITILSLAPSMVTSLMNVS